MVSSVVRFCVEADDDSASIAFKSICSVLGTLSPGKQIICKLAHKYAKWTIIMQIRICARMQTTVRPWSSDPVIFVSLYIS